MEGEMKPCWTCRERNLCEVTHSSSAHCGKLFRCVNCKAIYPDFALFRPAAQVGSEEVALAGWREEVTHPNNRLLFRRMAEVAGIDLASDTIDVALRKVAALAAIGTDRGNPCENCGFLPEKAGRNDAPTSPGPDQRER